MAKPLAGRRSLVPIAVASVIFATFAFAIPARADVPGTCGNTILVLDESGSMEPHEASLRQSVSAFLSPLSDSGVAVGVVEFGSAAKKIYDYTPVDATSLGATFGPYINATSVGDVYDAPSQLGPYTNWDDSLNEVVQMNTSQGVAPIVLFLTDGDPTAYNLDKTGEAGGVNVSGLSPESLSRAIEEADAIRAQGSHLIAVGLGSGLTNPDSVDRLKQVAGPDVYDGNGVLDLDETDVVLVPDFSDLPEVMALIAQAMCADPGISVAKSASSPFVIAGTEVTFSIDVTNTGNVDLVEVSLQDPTVPECNADIGTLAVGETVTVTCTTTIWAPTTNTATATGTDPFGTPVEDDSSTTVTLIATGTGTPGFWKNHTEVWPVAGDGILIGDWNHNGVCDGTETCVALSLEEALAALSTPPKGDMTWNMGRHLVAAWLNVSAGNEASCIMETINSAAGWLAAHPLGSGVPGSDEAWAQGSDWASLLDDYNNGRLCAEHRDSKDDSETTQVLNQGSAEEQEENKEAPAEDPSAAGGNPPSHSKGKGAGKSNGDAG